MINKINKTYSESQGHTHLSDDRSGRHYFFRRMPCQGFLLAWLYLTMDISKGRNQIMHISIANIS